MPQRGKYLWAAGLFLTTLLTFRQVVRCDFINFDDPTYVQNNPLVAGGLTLSNVGRAFTTIHAGYWIPLTWVSYQLDYSLYGLAAGGYHRTNLLLHAANVVLLFLLLCRLTGSTGRSAVVAALFALHPIQVESVAWVTERKDVLSTFFGLLALGAYVGYVERPGWRRYLTVVLLLALGLMAKPMLVTLPCVMLLLDFWPLRRTPFSDASQKRCGRQRFCEASLNLLRKKAPLFALALAAGVLTIVAQKTDTAVRSLDEFSLYARLGNAAVSAVAYLGMLLWPQHLAVFYPHPGEPPVRQVVAAVFVLLLLTGTALALARRAPYLLVGWLWYVLTLAPVSGVLQAGWQGRADRFLYVPSIGLFLLATWGLTELAATARRRLALGGLAAAVLAGCLIRTVFQVHHWQNSLNLWQHTVAVTPANFVADNSLAAALLDCGRAEDAVPYLLRARAAKPEHELAHYLLGIAYRELGRRDDAVRCWHDALKHSPDSADAHAALAEMLVTQGQLAEAERHALAAVRLDRQSAEAHHALGVVRDGQGRTEEALDSYREAVRLNPHAIAPRLHLADALRRRGQSEAAEAELYTLRWLYPNWSPPSSRPHRQ